MCGTALEIAVTTDGSLEGGGHYFGPLFAHITDATESDAAAEYWECDECFAR